MMVAPSWIGRPSKLADLLYSTRIRKSFRSVAVNSTTAGQSPTAMTNLSAGGTQTAATSGGIRYINGATVAAAGSLSGRVSGGIVQILSRPIICGSVETGSSFADVRWWLGIDDGAGMDGTDAPVENMIAFRATSGTTGWDLCASDGATFNTVPMGLAVAASTRYGYAIVVPGDGYAYGCIGSSTNRLSGWMRVAMPSALQTHTGDMSAISVVEAKAASAKAIRWGSWYSEWD